MPSCTGREPRQIPVEDLHPKVARGDVRQREIPLGWRSCESRSSGAGARSWAPRLEAAAWPEPGYTEMSPLRSSVAPTSAASTTHLLAPRCRQSAAAIL